MHRKKLKGWKTQAEIDVVYTIYYDVKSYQSQNHYSKMYKDAEKGNGT